MGEEKGPSARKCVEREVGRTSERASELASERKCSSSKDCLRPKLAQRKSTHLARSLAAAVGALALLACVFLRRYCRQSDGALPRVRLCACERVLRQQKRQVEESEANGK